MCAPKNSQKVLLFPVQPTQVGTLSCLRRVPLTTSCPPNLQAGPPQSTAVLAGDQGHVPVYLPASSKVPSLA